jgi:peptide/nickel transport system permease protein
MGAFLVRRTAAAVLTILGVSMLVFLAMHMVPGGFAEMYYGPAGAGHPELIQRLKHEYGLDQPIPIQYLKWLEQAVQGDLGTSLLTQQPVAKTIAQRIGVTAELTILATLISIIFGVPLGIYAAMRHRSKSGFLVRTGAVAGFSVPDFVLATLLVLLVSVTRLPLPIAGYVSPGNGLLKHFSSMLLPALTLGLITTAIVVRTTRASTLDVLYEPYVTTAKSKGLGEGHVVRRHVLRNALIPIVTVIGINFGYLLGGAVIVESVFSLPGMGRLAVNSVSSRDYPVVQGAILVAAILFVAVNMFVDILYGYIDPRVRT